MHEVFNEMPGISIEGMDVWLEYDRKWLAVSTGDETAMLTVEQARELREWLDKAIPTPHNTGAGNESGGS